MILPQSVYSTSDSFGSLFTMQIADDPVLTGFCRDTEGWGPVSEDYDFTPCFSEGSSVSLVSLFMIVLGSLQISKLLHVKPIPTPKNWHYWTKLVLVALNAVTTLAYARMMVDVYDDALQDIRVYALVLNFFAFVVAAVLHHLEQERARYANGVLLFFWLFTVLSDSIRLVGYVNREAHLANPGFITTFGFSFILSIITFVLEAFVPKARSGYEALVDEMDESPLDQANIFSRLTFEWMTPMMKLGYETYLTDEDLPGLAKGDKTNDCRVQFEKYWNNSKVSPKPSMVRSLMRAFGTTYLAGMGFKILTDILAFSQPQLLRRLILFINSYTDSDFPEPFTAGVIIAVSMFLVSLLQTAFQHQHFQRTMTVGMQVKSALVSSIYRKAVVLSGEAKSEKSTGDIVNLMSVDAQRLQDITQNGMVLWSGPFQIIICLYSLYSLLGSSMWAGVFVMIIMIPTNGIIARKMKALQKIQMKTKDERTRVTTEILTNIKSVKLYGWEKPLMAKLTKVRNHELDNMKITGVLAAITSFLWATAPFLVSCSTFGLYVFISDIPLSTDIVFPALSLFNLLTFPLAMLPQAITNMIEASVAANRLQNFFLSSELQDDAVVRKDATTEIGEESVIIANGTFLWDNTGKNPAAVKNATFVAKKGELACIVGRVGSGKSGFLQAILGDLYKEKGSVVVHGRVAYAAQAPWIMNATVKDNIIFGSKFQADFYEKTIKACALVEDFLALPDGDETIVGEKGISLSGGQKARLSLARAVYARADVYVLDDPLSAVDQHVGRHLIDHVLGPDGLLATKTRILATNAIPVLSQASNITMIRNGEIIEQGAFADVMAAQSEIYKLIKEFGKKAATPEEEGSDSNTGSETAVEDSSSSVDEELAAKKGNGERRSSTSTLRRASTASIRRPRVIDEEANKRSRQTKEHLEQGSVKSSVYKEYAKAANMWGVVFFMVLLVAAQGSSVLGNVWLEHWAEVNTEAGDNPRVAMYLGVYLFFGVLFAALTVCYTLVLFILCTIRAARILHNRMAESVIRSPMSFFDTTPIGRIINRFTTDVYRIDEVLTRVFSMFFNNTIRVAFTLIVISSTTPAFIILILPLTLLYLYYQRFYLYTSRELKRLDSVSRSPIYAHFQESLSGLSTIRAFRQIGRFTNVNETHCDYNLRAYFPSISANRWLSVRLEFIGSVIIFASAGLSILSVSSGRVRAGLVGLAMSYALQITQSLSWIVRMTVEVEVNTVSVERALEYSRLPSEAAMIVKDHRPPKAWPSHGEVVFDHYSTRYREGLDLVLKDINLSIKPREKVGIVGRTGAGKSSLTLSLFRLIEPVEGHIDIDAVDTSLIGLSDLRHRLAIIPQDSQAFEGTIRDNLDPSLESTDAQLWEVLELSHLKEHVSRMPGGLDARVAEAGSNLSVGQRQLMSLARALLTPSKILVLDEATAAVDVETDKLLQETIRKEFKDRTILTIAHRLNTIIDSDKIIVLSAGKVAEFDSPHKLLEDKNSLFYSLCKQGGLIADDGSLPVAAHPLIDIEQKDE
ncbi:P-loop containing nucleoside triphosphate hydrolase protein [Lipomyces oligophaga]|uniref:P-loop containing nucleoside triphosphate hydrolase protein n=1 Tax=Lipomyces oligophaga TaxID=45792 RepID=UPI0034CD3AA3